MRTIVAFLAFVLCASALWGLPPPAAGDPVELTWITEVVPDECNRSEFSRRGRQVRSPDVAPPAAEPVEPGGGGR